MYDPFGNDSAVSSPTMLNVGSQDTIAGSPPPPAVEEMDAEGQAAAPGMVARLSAWVKGLFKWR